MANSKVVPRNEASSCPSILVKGLCLSFGSTKALDGLTMEATPGIYGLLGPSGSGKTSLIRCILGILKPSSGSVRVFGKQPGSSSSLIPGAGVGYMPQEVTLYDDLTIDETLTYFGSLCGMSAERMKERTTFLLTFLALPEPHRLVRHLSGGQKRRVSLACALIHKPPLLILDEPTVGVDPVLREAIWTHLTELSTKEQLTVLITTHYVEEARAANRCGLMRDGRMLAEDSPQALIEQFQRPSLDAVFLRLCKTTEFEKSQPNGVIDGVIVSASPNHPTKFALSPVSSFPKEAQPKVGIACATKFPPASVPANAANWKGQLSAMVIKNVNTILRNKLLMTFNFMLPTLEVILFCSCIGLNMHSIDVAVYDDPSNADQSNLSQTILQSLSPTLIHQKMYSTAEDAITAVRNGEAYVALTFNGNFSACLFERMASMSLTSTGPEPQILTNSTIHLFPDMANQLMVMAVHEEVIRVFNQVSKQLLVAFGASGSLLDLPVQMEEPVVGTANPIYRNYMAPGSILSIAFLSAIPLTAMVLVVERQKGLIERSIVCGSNYFKLMIGLLLPQVVLLFFSSLALCICVFPIFGIPNNGQFCLIMCLTFLQSICGMCFGLLVSTLATDESTATMMALGFFYPNLLLSGTVWPVQSMPGILPYLAAALPQTVAIDSMRHIIARGWTILHLKVVSGFLVTGLWIGIFILASTLFAYKYRKV